MPSALRTLALFALLANSACSTVVEGRSQQITVDSSPQGAQCLFKQADDIVGHVTTPGTASISKSKNDLVIFCSKEGYESVSLKNRSDPAITGLGNMVLGQFSFVGNAVDSVTGANNKYDSEVFVKFVPAETPMAFPAPPGAPALQLPMESVAGMSMQVPMPGSAYLPIPASPPPALPAQAAASLSPLASNPSLNAAANLSTAVLKTAAQQQAPALTYAQAMAEAPRRPPFDAMQ